LFQRLKCKNILKGLESSQTWPGFGDIKVNATAPKIVTPQHLKSSTNPKAIKKEEDETTKCRNFLNNRPRC
jgi:hypothetical protein